METAVVASTAVKPDPSLRMKNPELLEPSIRAEYWELDPAISKPMVPKSVEVWAKVLVTVISATQLFVKLSTVRLAEPAPSPSQPLN